MQISGKSIWQQLKYQFSNGGIITQLILINVGLFISFQTIYILASLFFGMEVVFIKAVVSQWFYLPSDLSQLLIKPYTFFSYQFLHADFWHILFNMLVLFWMGQILSLFFDRKKILPLYLMGGFAGAFLFLLVYNLSPAFNGAYPPLVGASASIMALVGAAAMLAPDYEVRLYLLFRIKLKYIVVFLAILNFLTIGDGNAGGKIAHLGGLAFGVLYVYLLHQRRIDMAKPLNKCIDFVMGIFSRSSSKKMKVTINKKRKTCKPSSKNEIATNQEKIDAILDKISANGYDSLTKEEKDYLFMASKNKL